MVEKEIKIKVTTETDASKLDDLSTHLEQLKQESGIDVEINTAEVDEFGSSVDDATNSTDQLKDSVDSVNGENVSSTSSDVDNLGTSADNATNEIDEMQGSLDLLNAQALIGISQEISGIGSQAESMAQDMNTAAITVGQLATQTGVAEPKMVSLINNISNATFPNNEAMMYVKSLDQIGVSSENLGKSATDLDKINDAFGLGANRVNSLGQELSVLGVDMNNVSSSFNALAYANANTVGGMENYYSFLRKYDAQFNELGYNVDQASIIIAGATQKFGGGRAALSGLSNALEEADGDSRKLEQALGLQAGALDKASQITGEYEGQLQKLADEEADHKTVIDQLNAAWEDMSLALSPVLAPVSSFMGLIGQAGAFAVGINGIVTLAGSLRTLELTQIASTIATKAGAAAQWLLNGAMSANPIMIVVLAIIALIAVLGYLYFNNEQVRAAIDGLGQSFVALGQWIYTGAIYWLEQLQLALENLWNYIFTLGGLLPENVAITGNSIVDTIIRVLLFIATLPIQLGMIFMNVIAQTLGFGSNFSQRMINAAANAINGFINYIRQLPGIVMGEFNRVLGMVNNFINSLPDRVWDMGKAIIDALKASLGINSPGYMYYILRGEMERLENLPDDFNYGITRNVSNLGSGVVDAFNPKLNGVEFNDLNTPSSVSDERNSNYGGQVFNVTFEGCTFDKKERVNEVLDILNNYFSWNNATAGRTK